jgi:hypothetical protein
MTDDEVVRGMLLHARLSPSEIEIARLTAMYPMVKTMIESLYAVPASDGPMALIFDPAPLFVDWV